MSVHDRSDLERALDRIGMELRNQYVLGYYPSNREHDGRWRRIKVKVSTADHAKLHLYAKKGYYGPVE